MILSDYQKVWHGCTDKHMQWLQDPSSCRYKVLRRNVLNQCGYGHLCPAWICLSKWGWRPPERWKVHSQANPACHATLIISFRFCNMDYILLGALAPITLLAIFISYNIACQFKLKFHDQMAKLPKDIHIPDSVSMDQGIPKCHCPMHKVPCQAPHSLNLKPGVGQTDGEGIKQSWAEMNLVANSTKEEGPGSRHNTLDNHFGHHNWQKKVRLGMFPHVLSLLFSLTNFLVRCKFAHAVTLGDTWAETAT